MITTLHLEIELEIEFDATPYDPGVTIEIIGITYNDKPIELSTKDEKKVQEELEQQVADGKYESDEP